jgi:XTP/dITP diphosphohydrolase
LIESFVLICFSWDPIFLPKGEEQTYGEMTKERKNEISYRRVAVDKIIKHFAN